MIFLNRFQLAVFFVCFYAVGNAQTDTLVFQNGNMVIGELKTMERGVLTIETDYSDSDFKISWTEVREVYASTRFLISFRDGDRINGRLHSSGADSVNILSDDGIYVASRLENIVYLNGLKSAFWDRVNASIDIGFKFAKANNLSQFSVQSAIGYLADKWSTNFYYNDLLSSQDSITDTRRKEGGLNYRFYLPRDWYASPEVTYLSNTEQALKGRITSKLGLGKFFVHTNKSYWGGSVGASLLRESFTNDTKSRTSGEIFAGTEVNIFDIGDIDFLSSLIVYPSVTESKRFRTDFKVDAKYEFFDDFYIKLNLSLNYDNQPAVAGKETDYVFGVSFGWEL